MNHEQYRKLLLALRAQLRSDVNLLLDAALDLVATDDFERPYGACRTCRATWRTSLAGSVRGFVQRVIDRKEATLYHVENALNRLDHGNYGVCQACDDRIPEERLLIVPYAPLCEVCHSERAA